MARGSLTVAGELYSNGGSMSEKDYTMIAGGAGGTIVLVGRSINLEKNGLVSVRGGLSSDEVKKMLILARRRWRWQITDKLYRVES